MPAPTKTAVRVTSRSEVHAEPQLLAEPKPARIARAGLDSSEPQQLAEAVVSLEAGHVPAAVPGRRRRR